ncbi:MAG: FMN-binding negative transcriptional regulator [Proteobacteria bacterium]|nr:FMN-binding negative transcriptional regulator [Pseudomonadota bacterium]
MHPNPAFRKTEKAQNLAFARDRSFGALSINAGDGPLIAHVPFQLSEDGRYLEAHLVRSNPIARALKVSQKAVVAVSGGDGYISPDWYGTENLVPTWNYVAVHLRGVLQMLPDAELRGILERLSENMETRLLPKPIWKIDKVSDGALAKMMRQIVPIAMDIESVDGTWKLAQNKPDDARLGASGALDQTGFGLSYHKIADLMKNPPS